MKKLSIMLSLCLILLLGGCSMQETKEYTQVERELQLYNSMVESIFDNYELCEERAISVEADLKSFFVTAEFTDNLRNISEIFESKDTFGQFLYFYGDYNEYYIKLMSGDKQEFEEYIEGFNAEDCSVEYYMNSTNGNLVEYLEYLNDDTREMEVRVEWSEGTIKLISVVVKGERVSEEDLFKPE